MFIIQDPRQMVYRFIVENAQPSSFKSLGQKYGKDINYVFYGASIVKGADLKSYQTLNNQDSPKDKFHFYAMDEIVQKIRLQ